MPFYKHTYAYVSVVLFCNYSFDALHYKVQSAEKSQPDI